MSRPAVALLFTLSLGAFSCDLPSLVAGSPAGGEVAPALAPVAAAPPVLLAQPPEILDVPPAVPAVDPLVGVIAGHLEERSSGYSRRELSRLAGALVRESRARALEPLLVLAVAEVESGFDPFAVSPAGAVGLMQILPTTGEALARRLAMPWEGAQTLFDPIANLKLGVAYLEELLERYDDLPTALAAYNWGPSRIDRRLRRGRALPVAYSRRVLDSFEENGSLLGT